MIGIFIKFKIFQFKLFVNNGTKFGAPGNRMPLKKKEERKNERYTCIGKTERR